MIPAWLQRHLEATGAWNSDGIARRTRAGICGRCRADILTGLDADICALAVACDPQPIDVLGETLALISGRATYDLANDAGRLVLNHRSRWRIAGRRKWPVLAAHSCNCPALPADPSPPGYRTSTALYPENPPY